MLQGIRRERGNYFGFVINWGTLTFQTRLVTVMWCNHKFTVGSSFVVSVL